MTGSSDGTRGVPALAATILLLFVGCGGLPGGALRADEATPRVAIVGWDGATWAVIDPMLREGRLPNLARLLERGSRGVLEAAPPMYSPVLWTTLATGFGPEEHAVTGFVLPDPSPEGEAAPVLANTLHRHRAPLWQIASEAGRTVGFVGWWTTWPAEPVAGYVVSDHLAYNRWDAWARRPQGYQLTYPPELEQELRPVALRPEQVDEATLTRLAPFDAAERAEMMAATRPIMFHAPSVFRFGYVTDASNAAFARHLLSTREQPDLFALVFVLGDVAGHVFWHHREPEAYPEMDPATAHLAPAIPNVYDQLDRWTGEVLEHLDERTIVVVVSDHGMGAKGILPHPGKNPAGDHTPDGILVVSGPEVPRGRDLGAHPNLDFAPTVLAMLGLPVARDMPGAPIAEALPPARAGSVAPVDSYGPGRHDVAADGRSPSQEEYEERLRSLGYIR